MAKKLLIIYPHRPPCNLAGVHRPRLLANYFPEFGFEVLWLSVNPTFYEEKPDFDFEKTLAKHVRLFDCNAFKITKPRIVGDIGLRGFWLMYKKALTIIRNEKPDFLFIPIPSFYTALLGRILHEKTGILYGIDYIDPWVRDISNRNNLRAKLSLGIAKLLEPIAVKKASLISGVSELYYKPVLERNFKNKPIEHVACPYGFDINDYNITPANISFPWKNESIKPIVYAGAFLPNSGYFAGLLFEAYANLCKAKLEYKAFKFYFIGTGNYIHKSVTEYAAEAGISENVVEIRERFPYLHILSFLSNSSRLLLLGSTEKHYTASKTFQAVLSKVPIFSMFHTESSAFEILQKIKAGQFLISYNEETQRSSILNEIETKLELFFHENINWKPDYEALAPYSSRNSASLIAHKIEQIIEQNNKSL